jgi:hypothetical protein
MLEELSVKNNAFLSFFNYIWRSKMSVTEKRQKEWLETSEYSTKETIDANAPKGIMFIIYICCLVVLAIPIYVFIHEYSHAVVGVICGWRIEEFVVNPLDGYVKFSFNAMQLSQFYPTMLIYLAGGLGVSIAIWLLSRMYKPMRIVILTAIPYGLFEGIKGFLMATNVFIGLPTGMYSAYVELQAPISQVGMVIFLVLMVYQGVKIFLKPLGSME